VVTKAGYQPQLPEAEDESVEDVSDLVSVG